MRRWAAHNADAARLAEAHRPSTPGGPAPAAQKAASSQSARENAPPLRGTGGAMPCNKSQEAGPGALPIWAIYPNAALLSNAPPRLRCGWPAGCRLRAASSCREPGWARPPSDRLPLTGRAPAQQTCSCWLDGALDDCWAMVEVVLGGPRILLRRCRSSHPHVLDGVALFVQPAEHLQQPQTTGCCRWQLPTTNPWPRTRPGA